MGHKKEVIEKLIKIESQLARNTEVLDEHHKRSTQLEARMLPLEAANSFNTKLIKVLLATLGAIGTIVMIYTRLVPK